MSRAVIQEQFGGPEVLEVRDVAEPHAGPGEVRVRVTAAGLNPVDWKVAGSAEGAKRFGLTLPAGFGNDFAGVVDEVGDAIGGQSTGFAPGDRVYGGARGRAVADYAIVRPGTDPLLPTPDGVDDITASTLVIAGRTADAVISAIGVHAGDTVLIGGAAGGVGVFAVQLARLAGAQVIGTASQATFGFLRDLGAEPVTYGDGLADRVRALAPQGITAAADMIGAETALAALDLGVEPGRIATIAAGSPPEGVHATGGRDAAPGALERITAAIVAGEFVVPIAAAFPIKQTRAAVELQRAGHVNGKVVITLA
ncbi:MAG: NADP-dependent oxidoreductase [Streptosporangiaceae bacterium]|jgi:NADPH:quinone reductase-like Zn-dependent oxidoreductase